MSINEEQFQLPLTATNRRLLRRTALKREEQNASPLQRVNGIDQVLSTRDVEQITGRHRCTIWRWVQAGSFPPKRAGGGRGWLRSDVERWLHGDPGTPQ